MNALGPLAARRRANPIRRSDYREADSSIAAALGESDGDARAAQARGNFQVLVERNRRALRVHLGSDVAAGLGTLQRAIRAALENRRRKTAVAGGMRSTQAIIV